MPLSKQASKQASNFSSAARSLRSSAGDADRRLLRRWNHLDGRHELYGDRGRRRRRPHMDEDRYRPRRTPVPQACITYLWRSRRCSRRSARPSRTRAAPPTPQELHRSGFRARDATSAPCRGAPVPAYVGCVSDSDCNQVPRAHPALRLSPDEVHGPVRACLLYTSPSPRDATLSRMPSSA